MIRNVSFTGREEMLTKGIHAGLKKTHEFVSAGKVYTGEEIKAAKELLNKTQNRGFITNEFVSPYLTQGTRNQAIANDASVNWAISHGIPASEVAKINLLG